MKKLLLLALAALSFSITATAQQFHWGKDAFSNVKVATDKEGNIYTLGYVYGSGGYVDVDPGPGVLNVASSMLSFNTPYVLKYNKQGVILWVFAINRLTFHNDRWDIAVDNAQNVFVVGVEHIDAFDPGTQGFVKKINSNGSQAWDFPLGYGSTFSHASCNSVAVDSVGNVYVTGSGDVSDFDPGPNNVGGSSGQFIAKYTNAGDYVWNTDGGDQLIEVSRDGNSIYTVRRLGIYDYPVAITKRNSTGAQIWTRTFDSVKIAELNITEQDRIYVTGSFKDTIDIDPGAGVTELATAGGSDQFLAKMDTAGTMIWAKQLGGAYTDEGAGVVADGEGHLYTTGVFSGTVDMDPNAGVSTLSSLTPDTTDVFVQKLDTAGDLMWAARIGNAYENSSFGLAIDTAGAIIIIGQAYGADVNPETGSVIINDANFITKWSDTTVTVSARTVLNIEDNIVLYPNPSHKTVNVSAQQVIDNITVTDIAGRVVFTATPSQKKAIVDILLPGVYFISVTTGDKISRGKVLIQ